MNMATSKVLVALLLVLGVAHAKRFVFQNNYNQEVWTGSLGNAGKALVSGGGWKVSPGSQVILEEEDSWAGRLLQRTGCRYNSRCETGDCGSRLQCNGAVGEPPVSLAEITHNGWGGNDYYDNSLVDVSSIPISASLHRVGNTMELLDKHGGGDRYRSTISACRADIISQSPNELRLTVNGRVVCCKKSCLAFNTYQYCCRNAHNTLSTCKSSDWPVNDQAFFKNLSPDAYSYAYDDQ